MATAWWKVTSPIAFPSLSIDMYLPGFSQLATHFNVPSVMIALTLSSYFIGLALGQVIYGPLLDRFGRKRPLLLGLLLFIVTSIGCVFAPTIWVLDLAAQLRRPHRRGPAASHPRANGSPSLLRPVVGCSLA